MRTQTNPMRAADARPVVVSPKQRHADLSAAVAFSGLREDSEMNKADYFTSNSPSEAQDGPGRAAGVVRVNPITGNKYIEMPPRRRPVLLRHFVEGLVAFYDSTGLMIEFSWVRNEPTDEADARDAQCRAGWSDIGYGFYGFDLRNGIATWSCSRSCE